MAAFVQDLKTEIYWKYRKYTDEELAALANWLNGPVNKETVFTENLWENMKKLSTRVGIHTHPIFEYADYFIRVASKDV